MTLNSQDISFVNCQHCQNSVPYFCLLCAYCGNTMAIDISNFSRPTPLSQFHKRFFGRNSDCLISVKPSQSGKAVLPISVNRK